MTRGYGGNVSERLKLINILLTTEGTLCYEQVKLCRLIRNPLTSTGSLFSSSACTRAQ
jgi:hypothetical protein